VLDCAARYGEYNPSLPIGRRPCVGFFPSRGIALKPATDIKQSVNLPHTDFPMKANLPDREPALLRRWEEFQLYAKLRAQRAGRPRFLLHDGPPYANGNIHLGQALNKILKDMVVKSRSMMGLDAAYRPGWDCHGLPIEHRVDRELGGRRSGMKPLEIRK